MLILSEKALQSLIHSEVSKVLDSNAIERAIIRVLEAGAKAMELDPNKHYIVVLPSDMDKDDIKDAFSVIAGELNLVVLQTDNLKLIELG